MNNEINVIVPLIIANTAIINMVLYIMAKQSYKIGYYEQKLKSNKHKFSEEQWKNIEQIMKK